MVKTVIKSRSSEGGKNNQTVNTGKPCYQTLECLFEVADKTKENNPKY